MNSLGGSEHCAFEEGWYYVVLEVYHEYCEFYIVYFSGGCFTAGTPVHTELGILTIESIKPGTKVWAYDFASNNRILRSVEQLKKCENKGTIIRIIGQGFEIESTPSHPLWVASSESLNPLSAEAISKGDCSRAINGCWMPATALKGGDVLMAVHGNRRLVIERVEQTRKAAVLYDLEFSEPATYCVGAPGVLVAGATPKADSVVARQDGALSRHAGQ